MPHLTIFRGLPGSGKSTKARVLSVYTGAIVIEPDMFIIRNGEYKYSKAAYRDAVRRALSLVDDMLMDYGVDVIFADVLPRRSDVYIMACGLKPDDYTVIDCKITPEESLERNVHNVRPEDIERMAKEWEGWDEKRNFRLA